MTRLLFSASDTSRLGSSISKINAIVLLYPDSRPCIIIFDHVEICFLSPKGCDEIGFYTNSSVRTLPLGQSSSNVKESRSANLSSSIDKGSTSSYHLRFCTNGKDRQTHIVNHILAIGSEESPELFCVNVPSRTEKLYVVLSSIHDNTHMAGPLDYSLLLFVLWSSFRG